MVLKPLRGLALGAGAMLPLTLMAAEPAGITFGNSWSLDTATNRITYQCPTAAGYECSATPIDEENFYQVQIRNTATGETYFQTIVATNDGSGEVFSSESFVGEGLAADGIAAKQSINSVNNGSLAATSILSTGNFNTGDAIVDLSQDVADSNGEFNAHFGYVSSAVTDRASDADTADERLAVITLSQTNTPTAGDFEASFAMVDNVVTLSETGATERDSRSIDISTGVVLNETGGALTDQTFSYALREGDLVTAAGSASLPGGGSIDWVAGDSVEQVLVNQTVTGAGQFGFERLADIADTDGAGADDTQTAQFSSLSSVGPFASFSAGNPF